MLAAVYSETGKYQMAIATAQQALELAVLQRKSDLVGTLRSNIVVYQNQLQQAKCPGTAQ
jgi:hypothetical protein